MKDLAAPFDRDHILLHRGELPAGKCSVWCWFGGARQQRDLGLTALERGRLGEQLLEQPSMAIGVLHRLGHHRAEIVRTERTEHGRHHPRLAIRLRRQLS